MAVRGGDGGWGRSAEGLLSVMQVRLQFTSTSCRPSWHLPRKRGSLPSVRRGWGAGKQPRLLPMAPVGAAQTLKSEWGGLRPLGSHFHTTSLHLSPLFLSFLPRPLSPLSSPIQSLQSNWRYCKADLLKNKELNYHMTQPSHYGA